MWGPGALVRYSITPVTSAQPQINGPFHLRLERKGHFLSGPGGVIRGIHDFQHGAAIFASDQRLFFFPDAFDEVFKL